VLDAYMILCLYKVLATFLDCESHFIRLVYLVSLFLRLGGIQDISSRGAGVTRVRGIGHCSSTTEISINYAAAYKQCGNDTISVVYDLSSWDQHDSIHLIWTWLVKSYLERT